MDLLSILWAICVENRFILRKSKASENILRLFIIRYLCVITFSSFKTQKQIILQKSLILSELVFI